MGLEKGWGSEVCSQKNFSIAKKHFPELPLNDPGENIDFPNGSMFWFRPAAMRFLIDKDIKSHYFEEEKQQIDGTLAHAIERLFGVIVKESGFETKQLFFAKSTDADVKGL